MRNKLSKFLYLSEINNAQLLEFIEMFIDIIKHALVLVDEQHKHIRRVYNILNCLSINFLVVYRFIKCLKK